MSFRAAVAAGLAAVLLAAQTAGAHPDTGRAAENAKAADKTQTPGKTPAPGRTQPSGDGHTTGPAQPSDKTRAPDGAQPSDKTQTSDKPEGTGHAHPGMLAAAAEVLKLNRDELRRELKAGRTLADIAARRGIGKDELIRRLSEAAAKRIDAKVAEGRLPAARAEQLKDRLRAHIEAAVDSRDLLVPIHRHPGHRFLMHKIASVLGILQSELNSRLAEGRSIAEIAKSKGMSEDELIGKLKDSLTDELRRFVRMKHPVRPAPDGKTGTRP
jgi:hypothetical protein